MKKRIIILLGLPGSGKGTQGSVLAQKLSVSHVSTGEILRSMIKKKESSFSLLKDYMDKGKLVPTILINEIVHRFICLDNKDESYILDGYPRNLDQARYLTKNFNVEIKVILLDIDEQTVKNRIIGRYHCESCGKIYNKNNDKHNIEGVCDRCGSSKFMCRIDDSEEKVLFRIEEYKREAIPLIEYYKDKGEIIVINAKQRKKEITEEILSCCKEWLT